MTYRPGDSMRYLVEDTERDREIARVSFSAPRALPDVIVVAGRAGSGKSTVAAHLSRTRGYAIASLADPLKRFCADVFGWSAERLWGPSEARNDVDPAWGFSAREALQKLGTEWGRAMHPEIWIRYACRPAPTIDLGGVHGGHTAGRRRVFQDARFENEITTFRAQGALTILLEGSVRPLDAAAGAHSSETTEWQASWFDIVIPPVVGVGPLCDAVDLALAQWVEAR